MVEEIDVKIFIKKIDLEGNEKERKRIKILDNLKSKRGLEDW